MFDEQQEQVRRLLSIAKTVGRGAVIKQVQAMLIPHVMKIFGEHDHGELRAMILQDYQLVEEHTPENVQKALENVGSDPEMRRQFQGLIVESITPENIIKWLDNPEQWLTDDQAEEQREKLRKCAEVIRETQGGKEWLSRQVYEIYRMAGITPEDTKPAPAND